MSKIMIYKKKRWKRQSFVNTFLTLYMSNWQKARASFPHRLFKASLRPLLVWSFLTEVPPVVFRSAAETENFKFSILIHHLIKVVYNNFQSSSCVTWHTLAFSPSFSSLRKASWNPPYHLDHWRCFSKKQMDELKDQMHTWMDFFLFLKNMFRDCSSALGL